MDRLDIYNSLPESLKPLYEGTDGRLDVLDKVVSECNVSEEQKRALVTLFGDLILGIVNRSEFTKELQGIFETAVATTINQSFAPLVDFVEAERGDKPVEKIDTTPVPDADTKSTEPVPVTPAQFSRATPLHTMATDIEKIHGYGAKVAGDGESADTDEPVHRSSQDEVLPQTNTHSAPADQPTGFGNGGPTTTPHTPTKAPTHDEATATIPTVPPPATDATPAIDDQPPVNQPVPDAPITNEPTRLSPKAPSVPSLDNAIQDLAANHPTPPDAPPAPAATASTSPEHPATPPAPPADLPTASDSTMPSFTPTTSRTPADLTPPAPGWTPAPEVPTGLDKPNN